MPEHSPTWYLQTAYPVGPPAYGNWCFVKSTVVAYPVPVTKGCYQMSLLLFEIPAWIPSVLLGGAAHLGSLFSAFADGPGRSAAHTWSHSASEWRVETVSDILVLLSFSISLVFPGWLITFWGSRFDSGMFGKQSNCWLFLKTQVMWSVPLMTYAPAPVQDRTQKWGGIQGKAVS